APEPPTSTSPCAAPASGRRAQRRSQSCRRRSTSAAAERVTPMERVEVVRRPPFGDNPQVGERGTTTYRKILAAALDVFGEHGFHGTRVELITEAAGCSRPSFYQYFAGKDDVFWRLAKSLANAMSALSDELGSVSADAAGVARIEDWFDGLVDLYA